MDPLSALSLAGSIIQFIDFGMKVSKRLSEFINTDVDEYPRSLQAIGTQLPLLLHALERVKENVADGKLDFDTRCILRGVVGGCQGQVERVATILDSVTTHNGDSMAMKAKKAFKSLKVEEKIAAIEKNLQTYISVLVLHHVVDDNVTVIPDSTAGGVFETPVTLAPSYVQRTDLLDKIDQAFWRVKTSQVEVPVSLFLTGRAGVGKTQLALGYATTAHASGQFKSIFWIDASSPETLLQGLQNAANLVRQSRIGTATDKVDFMRKYLAERWHPWLVVLDNYRRDAFKNESVASMLPSSGCGAYLFVMTPDSSPIDGECIEVRRFLTKKEQEDLDSSFMSAVESENSSRALELLESGAHVNSGWHDYRTDCSALERATLHGLVDVVVALLDRGVDIKAEDDTRGWGGSLAVKWSAKHPQVVKIMFDHEEKLGVRASTELYDGMLEDATNGDQETHTEAVRMILGRRPVSVAGLDKAMATAANAGRTDVMMMLLQRKADYLRTDDPSGSLIPGAKPIPSQGGTDATRAFEDDGALLHKTISESNHECGRALITECARLGYPLSADSISRALVSACCAADWTGARQAKLDMMRHLLSIGADPNLVTDCMPLSYAAGRDDTEVMKILLEGGAQAWLESSKGETALYEAVLYSRHEAMKLLLDIKTGDEAVRQRSLSLSLLWAVSEQKLDKDLVLELLQAGADPNSKASVPHSQDQRGMIYTRPTGIRTPLVQAIVRDDKTLVRMLLKRGARPDVSDGEGQLPLHLAASKGQESTVREILKRWPAAIDATDAKGDTALIVAVTAGYTAIARTLLEAGADADLANKYEDAPLELAEEKGKKEMIELLQKHSVS